MDNKFAEFVSACILEKLNEITFSVRHADLIKIQESIYSKRMYAPGYRVFGGFFCPCCKKNLTKEEVDNKYILKCTCGYEYAGSTYPDDDDESYRF